MVALLAFVSLAVDLGHVYLVRSELQLAADSAAQYAVTGLTNGVATVQAYAVDAANDNQADGTPVALDPNSDVEFGTWDNSAGTFTVLSGAARSGANAVRVTARRTSASGGGVPLLFASVLGRTHCNITVSAIARAGSGKWGGFIGIGSMQLGNNASIAGYNSASGAPDGSNVSDGAAVGTNGQLSVGNNSTIRGDVLADVFNQGNNGNFTGQQFDDLPTLTYPAIESPTVAGSGTLNVGQNETVTLLGGTLNYSTISVDNGGTLTFTGATTLYVTGSIQIQQNAQLLAAGNAPASLRLRLVGPASFQASNNTTVIARVYGPGSSVRFGNGVQLLGSLIGNQVEFGNNATLYYDTAIGAASNSGSDDSARTSLVR